MKLPRHLLADLEDLEARFEAVTLAGRPEDRLSFAELAELHALAPGDREELLKRAARRTSAQVAALRRPYLDLVEAAFPRGQFVTPEGFLSFMAGWKTDEERRSRLGALLASRNWSLELLQMLHRIATQHEGTKDH